MEKLRYNRILEMVMKGAFEELSDTIETESDFVTLDTIEHESCPGFMPHTNGGYQITAHMTLMDISSTGKDVGTPEIVKQIDGYIATAYQDALEAFCEQESKLEDLFTPEQLKNPSNDVINYHDLYEMGEGTLAETLSEFEHEYLSEGSTLFLQYRVQYYAADNFRNQTGEDEVCFLSGINLDFEYGRDKGLEVTYEQTVKVSDLTPAIIKEHIEGMQKDI